MLKSPSTNHLVILPVSRVFKFKSLLLMETICDKMPVVSLVIGITAFSTDAVSVKLLIGFYIRELNVLIFQF